MIYFHFIIKVYNSVGNKLSREDLDSSAQELTCVGTFDLILGLSSSGQRTSGNRRRWTAVTV